MDESQEILLNSLVSYGVQIPPDVSSMQDLTPAALVSICSQSLRLIDDTSSFPASFPDSVADRFKICTDLASAVQNVGYLGDMNFHKFLYPSEEDLYKLVRFLVERLSGLSEAGKSADKKEISSLTHSTEELAETKGFQIHNEDVISRLNDVRLETEVVESSSSVNASENDDSIAREHVKFVSEIRCEMEKLRSLEKELTDEATTKSSELERLEEQHKMLKVAVEMALEEQHPVDYYIKQLNEQIDAKRHNLVLLESQWDALIRPLEEEKISVEDALCSAKPEAREKIKKLKEVEQERESVLSEIKRREGELSKLSKDVEEQPKLASRRSYIDRVKEITKNNRKQDADIDRILKETRELQLESNSIQERLHRTYAVVDETIFREAKKDPMGRQAYRLLTSIHESFDQICGKILATDRTQREAADYEAKPSAMTSQSLNIDKLQADIDAIRRENAFLEQRL